MSHEQPSSQPCAASVALRLMFAATRGMALLLGAFTLLNVLGELRNPGFDANLWWIDLRFANPLFRQGLRILFGSDLSEERFEVVIVPAGLLAFAAQASREPSVLLENHQRQLPEHGGDFGAGVLADAAGILCKNDIEGPVQSIR